MKEDEDVCAITTDAEFNFLTTTYDVDYFPREDEAQNGSETPRKDSVISAVLSPKEQPSDDESEDFLLENFFINSIDNETAYQNENTSSNPMNQENEPQNNIKIANFSFKNPSSKSETAVAQGKSTEQFSTALPDSLKNPDLTWIQGEPAEITQEASKKANTLKIPPDKTVIHQATVIQQEEEITSHEDFPDIISQAKITSSISQTRVARVQIQLPSRQGHPAQTTDLLLDSGASTSICSNKIFANLPSSIKQTLEPNQESLLYSATGHPIKIHGTFIMSWRFPRIKQIFQAPFLLVTGLSRQLIMGYSELKQLQITMDFANHKVQIGRHTFYIFDKIRHTPFISMYPEITTINEGRKRKNEEDPDNPIKRKPDSNPAPTEEPATGTQLPTTSMVPTKSTHPPSTLHPDLDLSFFKYDYLSQSHKLQLHSLLRKFNNLFATDQFTIGCPQFEVAIETSGHKPIRLRDYPLNPWQRSELRKHLDKLLAAGIIAEVKEPSSWGFPALIIKKKTINNQTESRLVIDYRQLCKIITLPAVHTPTTQSIMMALGGSSLYSSCDIRSAFHNLRIRESDQIKTSFVTPYGTFCYRRLPFGLSCSPLAFQSFMTKNLSDLPNVSYFMDDIIIYSREDPVEHMRALENLFIRLQRMSITLHPAKTTLLVKEIHFLGHTITKEGRIPNAKKTEAILDMPPPSSKKELRGFLGLANFLAPNVKNSALILAPLYECLQANKAFRWDERLQEEYEKIKLIFSDPILLACPDYSTITSSNPLILETDSSSYGFGAMLLYTDINDQSKEKPIALFSKKFKENQLHWTIQEKECYAVVTAVKYFETILSYYCFYIRSDCRNLRSLFTSKTNNPKLARWSRYLASYMNSEVQPFLRFVKGVNNRTDILSRLPLDRSSSFDPDVYESALPETYTALGPQGTSNIAFIDESSKSSFNQLNSHQMPELQLEDPLLLPIIKDLKANRGNGKFYMDLDQRLLYLRQDDIKSTISECVVLPQSTYDAALKYYHDNHLHPGALATLRRAQQEVWFPNMATVIKEYCRKCQTCLKYNPGKTPKSQGVLYQAEHPMDSVSVDVLSMPTTPSRVAKILVIICDFSNFVALYAIKAETGKEISKALRIYFKTYGKPKRLHSDNASQFKSKEFSTFVTDHEIHHSFSTPLRPESNGRAERIHREILKQLSKMENKHEWDKILIDVAYNINSQPNKHGISPFFSMFGRESNEHQRNVLNLMTSTESNSQRSESHATALHFQHDIEAHKAKMNKAKHHQSTSFNLGTPVLLKTLYPISKLMNKISPKFVPGFYIKKILNPTTFDIAHEATDAPTRRVHASQIKVDHSKPQIPME